MTSYGISLFSDGATMIGLGLLFSSSSCRNTKFGGWSEGREDVMAVGAGSVSDWTQSLKGLSRAGSVFRRRVMVNVKSRNSLTPMWKCLKAS